VLVAYALGRRAFSWLCKVSGANSRRGNSGHSTAAPKRRGSSISDKVCVHLMYLSTHAKSDMLDPRRSGAAVECPELPAVWS
jgi:hypothetical protein